MVSPYHPPPQAATALGPRARLFAAALAALVCGAGPAHVGAAELPATKLSYVIAVELDPQTRVLDGSETIRWRNPSAESVSVVPMQLYLNAFEHQQTTWMSEVPAGRFDLDEFLELHDDPWGWTDPTGVRQRVGDRVTEASWKAVQPDDGNPLDRTLISVTLPTPVPPGGELVLEVDWSARLPIAIARTGCILDFCLVAQWYPKLAVLETPGVRGATRARWAMHQFHGPTEFYAEFADYDVTITTPVGWTLAATGKPDDGPEAVGEGLQRIRHRQRAVHDFAWLVGQRLYEETHAHTPTSGGPTVSVRYIVPEGVSHQVARIRHSIEGTLDVLNRRVGHYPYEVLTVTTPPHFAGRTAGMEYPTFITGATGDPRWDHFPFDALRIPELVAVHELGHNYFYGLLGTEEREEAMLDEGFNSFWEGEVLTELYGDRVGGGSMFGRAMDHKAMRASGLERRFDQIREPMTRRPSWLFADGTWGAQIYPRPAVTLQTLTGLFGWKVVDAVFQEYFRQGVFGHPDFADFLAAARSAGGKNVEAFLAEAFTRERIPDYRVVEAKTETWKVPLGRLPSPGGSVIVTKDDRDDRGELGLAAAAREENGKVLVEITDPGWARGGARQDGRTVRQAQMPEDGAADADWEAGDDFHESWAKLEGSAWDHLPVDVVFRFADGVIVKDTWDGKAAWRRYHFLRKAPLTEVRIDPDERIAVDVRPWNNARSVEADADYVSDWGSWLGAAAQWLVAGLSLWL